MPDRPAPASETASLADGTPLEAFYDERYRRGYMARHDALEVERVRDTLSAVGGRPLRVLDYGCGSGAWVEVLAERFPEAEIVGVEISEAAVEHAKGAYPEHRFVHFDGGRAPLPDAGFDVVFSYHVLEHVWDLADTIADVARLAAPGGCVCACLPCANRGSIGERATRLVAGGLERSPTGESRFFFEDPGHLRSVDTAALARAFGAHGLVLETGRFSGRWAEIEYFSHRAHRVRALFDSGRAASRGGAAVLAASRAALLAAGALVRLGSPKAAGTRPDAGDRGAKGTARRLLTSLATPLAALISEHAPRAEWRLRPRTRGGAAQYLVFRKPPR